MGQARSVECSAALAPPAAHQTVWHLGLGAARATRPGTTLPDLRLRSGRPLRALVALLRANNALIGVHEKVGRICLLLRVLQRAHLVDTRAVVGRVATEGDPAMSVQSCAVLVTCGVVTCLHLHLRLHLHPRIRRDMGARHGEGNAPLRSRARRASFLPVLLTAGTYFRWARNLLNPESRPSGLLAWALTAGVPSKTMTRSAR